jgi:hypothetical protein
MLTGTDEHAAYVRAVQKVLSERMGYSVSLNSLPKQAVDLIYLHLSRKDNITDRVIYNIAMELSVLYRTELKKPMATKAKRETSEERYERTKNLYLGYIIIIFSGWFIFVFLWMVVNMIWEVITGLFN